MSARAARWAQVQDVRDGYAKLILVFMADWANNEGLVIVSLRRLSETVPLERSLVSRKITKLTEMGLIERGGADQKAIRDAEARTAGINPTRYGTAYRLCLTNAAHTLPITQAPPAPEFLTRPQPSPTGPDDGLFDLPTTQPSIPSDTNSLIARQQTEIPAVPNQADIPSGRNIGLCRVQPEIPSDRNFGLCEVQTEIPAVPNQADIPSGRNIGLCRVQPEIPSDRNFGSTGVVGAVPPFPPNPLTPPIPPQFTDSLRMGGVTESTSPEELNRTVDRLRLVGEFVQHCRKHRRVDEPGLCGACREARLTWAAFVAAWAEWWAGRQAAVAAADRAVWQARAVAAEQAGLVLRCSDCAGGAPLVDPAVCGHRPAGLPDGAPCSPSRLRQARATAGCDRCDGNGYVGGLLCTHRAGNGLVSAGIGVDGISGGVEVLTGGGG